MDIAELLAFAVKNNASDLHLSSGLPPMIRVDGDVRRLTLPALDTASRDRDATSDRQSEASTSLRHASGYIQKLRPTP
jgi:Tfp pilus assembly pilus retraction ATPase PilT